MRRLQLVGVIALGGVLGAEARYGVDRLVAGDRSEIPWGTLVVNGGAPVLRRGERRHERGRRPGRGVGRVDARRCSRLIR